MKSPYRFHVLLAAVSAFAMHHAIAAADAAAEGKELYHAACSMCHGAELKAAGGIPDLRMTLLDDQAFAAVVREGRPGTIMPPMKGRLSDEEIGKIRAYIRTSAGE
jgi:quinohemoprotein ethanol dehydrogenase